jgi:hypothetical protein
VHEYVLSTYSNVHVHCAYCIIKVKRYCVLFDNRDIGVHCTLNSIQYSTVADRHRLIVEVDLQSLFGLHVTHLDSHTRALLVSL